MTFLFDTNVVSDLRRPQLNPLVANWASGHDQELTFISVVTLLEARYGALSLARRDPSQGQLLVRWVDEKLEPDYAGRILPITSKIARLCAELHIPRKRPERDAYIAATALVHDFTVVTRNTRDFEDTGVRLFNPWE